MNVSDKIKQKRFADNNGRVFRTINLYRYKYIPLSDVRYALVPPMTDGELTDSINYLHESGYIKMRRIDNHEITSLADTEPDMAEAKLTDEGIKLLAGLRQDDCISV